jgi:hypothetical protein
VALFLLSTVCLVVAEVVVEEVVSVSALADFD